MKKNKAKVEWHHKTFTPVEPDEKRKLFSKVDKDAPRKLFEDLNERLSIQQSGEITYEDKGDGYYPVFEMDEGNGDVSNADVNNVYASYRNYSTGVVTEGIYFASANFTLKLLSVKEEIKETAKKECRQVSYVFSIYTGWGEFQKEVPSESLEDFKWVSEATEGRAYFADRKDRVQFPNYVHEVIERDINAVEQKRLYMTNGWKKIEDRLYYVVDSGIIGQVSSNISANPDMKFEIDKYMTEEESIKKFMSMQDICIRTENAQMLMAFTNLSVITSFFEAAGFPIKFILGVFGVTNSLKTSTAMVFSKIFNAQETKEPEVTFSSTCAGIETFVAKYSDAILLVDDFKPGDGKAEQSELNSKLELLRRLYGDRTSKKRMTVFAKQEVEYPVRGCCMITGELVTGVKSSRTRTVNIQFEDKQVNKEILGYYQDNPLILPTYLHGWIKFATINQEEIIELIKVRMKQYRSELKFSIARLNEAAAHFLTVIDGMSLYWKQVLQDYDIDSISDEWKENILRIFAENDTQLANKDNVVVILQALEEVMQKHPEKVKPVEELRNSDQELIYINEGKICIQPKDLYLYVKSYCIKYDEECIANKDMMIACLKDKKCLECIKNSNGHTEASRKLRQSQSAKRYLFIYRSVMEDILEKAR